MDIKERNNKMKNKINLKGVDIGTWLRTIAMIIVTIGTTIAVATGRSPFPFDENAIFNFLLAAANVIAVIIAWWKNNSFTEPAQEADEVLEEKKEEVK